MNFSFTHLKVGSLVEIETLDTDNKMIRLKTIVEDITNESELKLFAPVRKGKTYPLRVGQSFNLITVYKSPTVEKYDILSCRCKIINKEIDGNISTVTIQKVAVFKQVQRRDYFRLPLIKTVKIVHDGNQYDLLSKDLSGSGIRGYLSKRLPAESEAVLYLDVETKVIEINFKIVECNPDPDHTYRYELRGSFVNIKNSQLSQLLKYIFAKQSETIKRQIDMDEYVSILDTDQSYSDFFSMSNLEKIIRISPIMTWTLTLLDTAYVMNAFRDDNMGINFFFGQFTRTFRPEDLMTANIIALVTIVAIIIGFLMNTFFNKKKKLIINIQYAMQLIISLVIMIAYQILT
jgi:c-di-GMP-binding flagellar brake protein YcgR